MCGACGLLSGGPDWIDQVGNADGVPHPADLTRRAERQRRIRLVNLLLASNGARLRDFGSRLVLSGPTGKTEVVDSLMHAWIAADRVCPCGVDPLDETLLRRLENV